MNEIISGTINNYCYLSSSDFSNISTTANITGTSSNSCVVSTTTDLPYNYIYINDNDNKGVITSSNSLSIGSTSNYITLNGDYFKDGFIRNLLDKIIEIKSLTKSSLYEFFNLKKINFYGSKTKIVCTKEIDLEYLNELKNNSVLLLECIDVPKDNYKEKAIKNNSENNYVLGGSIIYNNTWNNNITITNPYVWNGTDNFNWTYNTNNTVTYTV